MPPQLALFPRTLTQPGACFVTLEVGGQLQGCLGSVSAQSPLILDVYHKARASAC
ncbi:AMMECR1 domain-containing protein [Vibrio sp. PP-XX7]